MGAFYNSISIPGHHPEQACDAIERWLRVRGYELSDEAALFDLDGDNERSVFVLCNERWTILFFSHHDEEWRLIRELQSLELPLLYVWVYDSDVWGYDVLTAEGFAGSFSSDPRAQISFPGQPPGTADRPAAQPAQVCRILGLPDLGDDIEVLQRRNAAYKEDVCREFCRLIGAEAALASYDDLECGVSETIDGWQSAHLLFVRQHYDTDEIDLHAPNLLEHPLPAGLPRVKREVDLPPELLAEMDRMRRRARMTMRVLRPAAWLARGWRRLYEASFQLRGAEQVKRTTGGGLRANYRIDGRQLINDRHGCRVRLPAGARPLPGSRKPSSVFAFQIDDVNVTCTARRLSKIDEILRQPSGSKVLRDELFHAAENRVRQFLFEMSKRYVAGSSGPSFLGMYIVQTVQGLYVFLYRCSHRLRDGEEEKIRSTVESFELIRQRGLG